LPPMQSPFLWLNGEYVAWDEATMHLTDASAAGMTTVFEGIRGYTNPHTGAFNIPLLPEHWDRFAQSLKVMGVENPYTAEDFTAATLGLLERNGVTVDSYIRPIGYLTGGGSFLTDGPSFIAIYTRPYASHLGSGKHQAVAVSSWTRIADNSMPPRLKATPNYHNSRLAMRQALRDGYDGAIMLNNQGTVAEGPGSCLFMLRGGVAYTTPVTAGILESITRAFMIRLLPDALGVPVVERAIDRTELYVCDEIFFCGTGAEVTPVSSVDRFTVGNGGIGPVTARVEQLYHDILRGLEPAYAHVLTTYQPAAVAAD
jgi:branched-chain amino acid aminotransferase